MRWLRRHSPGGDQPEPEKAREQLRRVMRRRPEVERLIDDLKTERELNHFGQNVQKIFQGKRP